MYNDVPLSSGTADQTVIGPHEEYCPTLSSSRKAGTPTHNNMTKYGMRNAPETVANFIIIEL